MATNVNYEDERFQEVEAQKQQALKENEQLYDSMIGQSDQFYQAQIDATKQWEKTQKELQQQQTDFTLEQIEQQKDKAQKEYIKEQKGAYKDYKEQSNQFGVEAERMAAQGLSNTGVSETAKVSMHNTYQNRVASARESINNAVLSFNNAMKEAQLQNSSSMAEIALNSLQKQLEYAIQGFQNKNALLLDQANKKLEIDNLYHNRYQEVIDQIKYEEQLAYQKAQDERNYQLQLQQLAEEKRQFNVQNENYNIGSTQVKTQYYSGPIAENVGGYGYMGKDSNGVAYQPKGVYINGKAYKLSKSGKTAGEMFGKDAVNSSGVNIANQNVWKANGQYYIWNGTRNQYERVG